MYDFNKNTKIKVAKISHFNIANIFDSSSKLFKFNQTDTWILHHSLTDYLSIWEIWGALLFGGKLVLASSEEAKDPMKFYSIVNYYKITILNQTSYEFANFQLININAKNILSSIKYIILEGEKLPITMLKPWFEKYSNHPVQIFNMNTLYEIFLYATYKKIEKQHLSDNESFCSIGKVLPNLY